MQKMDEEITTQRCAAVLFGSSGSVRIAPFYYFSFADPMLNMTRARGRGLVSGLGLLQEAGHENSRSQRGVGSGARAERRNCTRALHELVCST